MDNYISTKEVYYHHWCQFCVDKDTEETLDPCDDCLHYGWNEDSHRPVNFKKHPDVEKKEMLERIARMHEHEMELQEVEDET